MPIRKPKPTSPGRRFVTYPDFAEITKTKPEKGLTEEEANAAKSFRNLANVLVLNAENAGVADIVRPGTLVASQAAIDALTARAAKPAKETV